MKQRVFNLVVILAVGLSGLLSAANLVLGDLNQDEGWYLYAARQVMEGRVLYRDFMFTQSPALPVVYGLLYPVVEKFGVAGGRCIATLFGLSSIGFAAWLAFRISSKHAKVAALCTLILTGVNVYQSYFTTIVKTYSLCAFFLTAGFVALSYANGRRGISGAFFGGALLALAACTRLSAGIALPIAGLWLIYNQKKVCRYSWIAFGLGGGAVLAVGLGSFFILAPENTHFALFGYHAGRSPGGMTQVLALKMGFISRFVQAYFVLVAGCVAAFLFRRYYRHVRETSWMECDIRPRLTDLVRMANQPGSPFAYSFISLLWITGLGITLVHFLAPFPYDDYQVIIIPVLSAAMATTLIPRCQDAYLTRVVWAVFLICTAASFSSPINQDWLVRGRDRIWWKFKPMPDLLALQRAGAEIRAAVGPRGLLLTQDTYLAVESGARVPHGMEMGPFSYYPNLSREQAETLNLINTEMLHDVLNDAQAPMAALSGYGLTIESPGITEMSVDRQKEFRAVLKEHYTRTREIEYFGQAHTTLEIFERNCAH